MDINEDSKAVRNDHLIMMSRMISHNLRSPVAGLKMLLPLYEKLDDEVTRAEVFGNIKEGAAQLFEMIEDLSQVLIDYKELANEKENINLEDCLNSAKEKLAASIPEDASLNANFSLQPEVVYSRKYLDFLFWELINNSIQYRERGRSLQIDIKSYSQGQKSVLEFKDNGIGIDMKESGNQLFQMYKPLHNIPDMETKGIGLFKIKNQIEMMGGRLSVDSTPGEGSIIKVELFS